MKFIFSLLLSSILLLKTEAQILPVTAQYFDQKFTTFPSLAGITDYNILTLSSQKQWIGIDHSPVTFILNFTGRIGNFDFYKPDGLLNKTSLKTMDRGAIGIGIFSDKIGYINITGINLTYSYQLPLGKNKIAFGYSIKGLQTYFDNNKLKPLQPDDPYIPQYNETNYTVNSNIGTSYFHPYSFYTAISVNNVFTIFEDKQKKIDFEGNNKIMLSAIGGKYFYLKNFKIMEPYISIAYQNNKVQTLTGVRYFYKKGSWISVMENNNFNEIKADISVLIRKFSYCLGYNFYTTDINKFQKGSLEFSIIARFGDLSRIDVY